MAALDDLLVLQGLDTAIEQANHRLTHLPAIERRRECLDEVARLERESKDLEGRQTKILAALADGERRTSEIDSKIKRLEGQMKTIIAPREAEALQHEISTLRAEREQSDDSGLAALEEGEQVERLLEATKSELLAARLVLDLAMIELRAAQAVIEAEIDHLAARRAEQIAVVDAGLLRSYDTRRARTHRVVVARLAGDACGGCHLDLSQLEREELRRLLPGEIPECPHCGCMLVL